MVEVIGVDEAGRGPVLGSMFVAAIAVPDGSALPAAVRDSKDIPEGERGELAGAIADDSTLRTAVVEVPVRKIDESAGRLNHVTASAASTAIDRVLTDAADDPRIVVDACDTDERRYSERVETELPAGVAVTAEHGADEHHPPVSAASILAKEAREDHVAELHETYGPCGSGYPSDPSTRAFLADYLDEHGELPDCARSSWKTCADLEAAAAQGSLTQF